MSSNYNNPNNTLVDQQMEYVLETLAVLTKGAFNFGRVKQEDFEQFMERYTMLRNLGNTGRSNLYEIKGMSSKQMEAVLAYCGIDVACHKQLNDGSILIAVKDSDIQLLKDMADKLNSGEISIEDIYKALEEKNKSEEEKADEEKQPDKEEPEKQPDEEEKEEDKETGDEETPSPDKEEKEPDEWEEDISIEDDTEQTTDKAHEEYERSENSSEPEQEIPGYKEPAFDGPVKEEPSRNEPEKEEPVREEVSHDESTREETVHEENPAPITPVQENSGEEFLTEEDNLHEEPERMAVEDATSHDEPANNPVHEEDSVSYEREDSLGEQENSIPSEPEKTENSYEREEPSYEREEPSYEPEKQESFEKTEEPVYAEQETPYENNNASDSCEPERTEPVYQEPEKAEPVYQESERTEPSYAEAERQESSYTAENPSAEEPISYKQDIAEREKAYQEEIIRQQEESRRANENATVEKAGTGSDMPDNYKKEEEKQSPTLPEPLPTSPEKQSPTPPENGGNSPSGSSTPDIQIRKAELNEIHMPNTGHSVRDAAENTAKNAVSEVKNTNTYTGYKEFKESMLVPLAIVSGQASMKNIAEKQANSLLDRYKNGGFDSLNRYMTSANMSAAFGGAGVNFNTVSNMVQTETAVFNNLKRKGLASFNGNSWDFTKMNDLLKKPGGETALERILGIDKTIDPTTRKQIARQMIAMARSYESANMGRMLRDKNIKQLGKNLMRQVRKDNATIEGYYTSKQTVKILRTVYRSGKMVTKLSGRVLYGMTKPVGRFYLKHSNSKFADDVRNKRTKIQQFNQRREERKQSKIRKKNQKTADKINKANVKKKLKEVGRNRRNARIQNRLNKMFGLKWGRRGYKAGSFMGKVMGMPARMLKGLFGGIANIFNLFNKLKSMIISAAGTFVLILLLIILLGGTIAVILSTIGSFFASVSDAWNKAFDPSPENVFDSIAGSVVEELVNEETQWVNNIKGIQDNNNFKLSTIQYGPDLLELDEYVTKKFGNTNVRVEDGSVIMNPFGTVDMSIIPEGALKRITNVDGGVELSYVNASGSMSRTSNIKEIMSMCSVYFIDEEGSLDYADEAEAAQNADSPENNESLWSKIKSACKSFANWIVNPPGREKMQNAYVMSQYCYTLFNISHQEQFDIDMEILPTKKTLDNSGVSDTTDMTLCPAADMYGCSAFNDFYYDKQGHACIKSTAPNGAFIDVSGIVTPGHYESGKFIKDEVSCQVLSGETNPRQAARKAIMAHPSCWVITTSTKDCTEETEVPNTRKKRETTKISSSSIPSITADGAYIYEQVERAPDVPSSCTDFLSYISWYTNNKWGFKTGGFYDNKYGGGWNISTDGSGNYTYSIKIRRDNGKTREERVTLTETYQVDVQKYRLYSISFTHSCQGGHTGKYCGGHVSMDVIGRVYGFTDTQLGPEIGDVGEIVGKVEEGEYTPVETDKTLIDDEGIKDIQDIFDADMLITRPVFDPDWEGWTENNMTLAVVRYNQDWEDIYGIVIASELGGEGVSETEIKEYMDNLQKNYPDLSARRREVIELALRKVGNMNYSQEHHNCKFGGPCVKGGVCNLSDCSGFVSNLWYQELGQFYTTATFYQHFTNEKKLLGQGSVYSNAKPGDIILHYDGRVADGNGDHALLYVGDIKDDGNMYVIDCTTIDGVGNVFLRTRDEKYYRECYTLLMNY